MHTHIVRVNEKIERIANIYNLTEAEIIKINQHIKDWNNLIPGTKLRLPEIPEIVQAELDNTEPFIEEYYPKITEEEINQIVINKEKEIIEPKPTKHTNHQYYPKYYPMNGYYNSKYYNEYIRKKTKK